MLFNQYPLNPTLIQGLSDAGYTEATPLQQQVLPPALEGNSILAKARSGQGKDGAFIIPTLSKLSSKKSTDKAVTKALILTSSPPAVAKIDELIWIVGYHAHIQSAQIVFKGDRDIQEKAIAAGTDVLVSNPRYFAELCQNGKVDLSNLEVLVLDDLDILLNEGDAKHLYTIIESIKPGYQVLAFADRLARSIDKVLGKATQEITTIGFDNFELRKPTSKPVNTNDSANANNQSNDHDRNNSHRTSSTSEQSGDSNRGGNNTNYPDAPPAVSIPTPPKTAVVKGQKQERSHEDAAESTAVAVDIPSNLRQAYIRVPSRMKITTLTALVEEQQINRMAVFTASKRGSDRLFRVFKSQQRNVVRVNSRQSMEERLEMIERFNNGDADIILVSEINPAETKLNNTNWIINYDVPDTFVDYSLRINTASATPSDQLLIMSLVSDSDTESIARMQDKQPHPLEERPLPERAQKKFEEKKTRTARPAEDRPAPKPRGKKPAPTANKSQQKSTSNRGYKKNDNRNQEADSQNNRFPNKRKQDDRRRNDYRKANDGGNTTNKPPRRRKRTEAAKLTELPQANFDRLDQQAANKKAEEKTGIFGMIKRLFK